MVASANPPEYERGTTPVPDPTELTSRAVDALRNELTDLIAAKMGIIEERVKALDRLTDERLKAMDASRIELKADSTVGLTTALAAAEKAVGKTETNFTEQLKGQGQTTRTELSALTVQLQDQKDRLTRIEAGKTGGQEVMQAKSQNLAGVYAAVGALVGVSGIATAIIVAVSR
jgi:chromosome segregation ATPase